jgi:hypothetical protein
VEFSEKALQSFWNRVERTESCWLWRGAFNTGGYGVLKMDKRMRIAHRVSWELLVGPIPDGLTIDHLCKVRACINPAHLEPVTSGENALRGDGPCAQNARLEFCIRGHPFTKTYVRKGHAKRACRICINASAKARRTKKWIVTSKSDNGSKIQCKHGHPFNEENTIHVPATVKRSARRICRACRTERHAP